MPRPGLTVKQTKTLNKKGEFSAYRLRTPAPAEGVGNFVDRGVSKRIPPGYRFLCSLQRQTV